MIDVLYQDEVPNDLVVFFIISQHRIFITKTLPLNWMRILSRTVNIYLAYKSNYYYLQLLFVYVYIESWISSLYFVSGFLFCTWFTLTHIFTMLFLKVLFFTFIKMCLYCVYRVSFQMKLRFITDVKINKENDDANDRTDRLDIANASLVLQTLRLGRSLNFELHNSKLEKFRRLLTPWTLGFNGVTFKTRYRT